MTTRIFECNSNENKTVFAIENDGTILSTFGGDELKTITTEKELGSAMAYCLKTLARLNSERVDQVLEKLGVDTNAESRVN